MKLLVLDNIGFVKLVDQMSIGAALKTVNAARISYNSSKTTFDEKDSKLLTFLNDHQHTSPFRHSYFTFHIKMPLFVARQWVKYQVGSTWRTYELNNNSIEPTISADLFDLMFDTDKGTSWNEISARYTTLQYQYYLPVELRSNPPHGNKQSSGEYVNPLHVTSPDYKTQHELKSILQVATSRAFESYDILIKNGVAKEIARMILPQNVYTEAYWTVSLQGLLHFLQQRLKNDAQFEIRNFAQKIYKLLSSQLDVLGISLE